MEDNNKGEFISVAVTNPTKEDFTQRFNGEPYLVPAGGTKNFSKYVSFHLAKHLSSRMIEADFPRTNKRTEKMTPQEVNREAAKFSQLTLYDNPKRRIALFKILRDTNLVMDVIISYPFKGFLEGEYHGQMEDYKNFVREEGGEFTDKGGKVKPTLELLQEQIEILQSALLEKDKETPEPKKETIIKKEIKNEGSPKDVKKNKEESSKSE